MRHPDQKPILVVLSCKCSICALFCLPALRAPDLKMSTIFLLISLSLLGTSLCQRPVEWEAETYPNPMTQPVKCGRRMTSKVCDPNGLISKEDGTFTTKRYVMFCDFLFPNHLSHRIGKPTNLLLKSEISSF